jgi:hypothetical protein
MSDITGAHDNVDEIDASDFPSFGQFSPLKDALSCLPPDVLEFGFLASDHCLSNSASGTSLADHMTSASSTLPRAPSYMQGSQQFSMQQALDSNQHSMGLGLSSASNTPNSAPEFSALPHRAPPELDSVLGLTDISDFASSNSPNADNVTTRITLENVERDILANVVSILVNSRGSVRFEMTQQ